MSRASVSSGKDWEREVAGDLSKALATECKRVLDESREGNRRGDIDCGPWHLVVQCKNYRRPRFTAALDEALAARDASGTGALAVAAIRQKGTNRHDPSRRMALLRWDDFLELLGSWARAGEP